MREQQTMNIAMSIWVDIYLGVFDSFPTFLDMVKEHELSSYYKEVVLRDVDFNNKLTYVTADDRAVSEVRLKLQAQGIPNLEVQSQAFDGVIKTNGSTVFILREADYERAVELAKDILREQEKTLKKEQEQEEELERTREEEIREAREHYEKDASEQELEPNPDTSPAQEEPEENAEPEPEKDGKKDKKRQKAKRREQAPPTPAGTGAPYGQKDAYGQELYQAQPYERYDDGNNQPEPSSDESYRQLRESEYPDTGEAHRRAEEQRARELRDRDAERRAEQERLSERESRLSEQRASEQRNREREAERRTAEARERSTSEHRNHTKRAASEDGNQFKSVDYHNRTVTEDGSGYEARREAEQQSRIAEAPVTDSAGTHHTGSSERYEGNRRPAESERESGAYTAAAGAGAAGIVTTRVTAPTSSAPESSRTTEPYWTDGSSPRHTERETGGFSGNDDIRRPAGGETHADTSHTAARSGYDAIHAKASETSSHTDHHERHSGFSSAVIGTGSDVRTQNSNTDNTSRMQSAADPFRYFEESHTSTNRSETKTGQDKHQENHGSNSSYSNASVKDLRSDISKSVSKPKISVGKIKEGAVAESLFNAGVSAGESSIFSESTKTILNRSFNRPLPKNAEVIFSEHGGHYRCVVRMDITGEVLKNRTLHKVADIANAGKIRSMIHSSRRLLVSSTINRDSDAGMAAQEAIDVGSPTGRIMFQNILHNGGIQFTKDTPFSLNTFAAAYAAANRLTMEEATERVKAFTLSGAFKGLDNPSMYQMDQAIAKSEHVAQYLKSNGPLQFNDMIRRLSDAGFREFIQNADLSDRLKEALINYNRAQLSNPDVIAGLLKNHTLPNDAEFLKTLHAADMNNRFGKGSFSGLIQRYILQIFKRMARDADAGRAWMEIYYSSRYLYSAYSSMVKLTMKVLGKFGITDPARLSGMIVDPLGTMRRAAQKKAVGLVAKTKPVKAVSRFGASAAKSLRKRVRTRIMKSGTVQVARRIKNLKAVAKITNLAGKLSKTVAHVAVKLGTLLGWIAVIVIVIALLLEIIQSQIKEEESTGMSNYITAQDTDIVQEIVAELTAKNQKFIADINDAANHRGSYASSVGVTANENVSYYDSYSIVFRDAYGNELDGTHVDLNNTKAIIAMASKFMPYAFQEPGENASEAKKLAYESIKQHFKDYCNFLWASTHQITIEEYHPGDSKYSNYDTSGLETTLDKGKCDQDGTTIWLPADFNPNKITHRGTEQVCSTCSPLPNTRYGEMGYALCGHAKESAEIEGWSKTGATREARNCYGDDCHHFGCDHSDGDYNCTSCEYESLEHVKKYHRSHWHTEYEWKYECGGHMGNVVYVTIGDLSRFPGMPAAEDVDYDAVAVYPSEYGTSTPESTGSTESSEAETGASE